MEECSIADSQGADAVDSTLRSRDRRRLRRHGSEAEKIRDYSSTSANPLLASHPVEAQRLPSSGKGLKGSPQSSASERVVARDRKSSDCRVRLCGREGLDGHAHVQYSAHGVAFDVDLQSMVQNDSNTGQTLKVRRLRAGSWSVKKGSQKSNGWTPYPDELSMELERVYAQILLNELEATSIQSEPQAVSELSLSSLLAHIGNLASGEMSHDEVQQAKQATLEKACLGPNMFMDAAKLITHLARRQGLRCSSDDARKAGLIIGSMSILKAVLGSDPEMQLFGVEIFNQKYAGIKLNMQGRKDCIRSLLARGMILGSHAPSSKLLKKVEADSLPLWETRFLSALFAKFDDLPEQSVTRIWSFYISGHS